MTCVTRYRSIFGTHSPANEEFLHQVRLRAVFQPAWSTNEASVLIVLLLTQQLRRFPAPEWRRGAGRDFLRPVSFALCILQTGGEQDSTLDLSNSSSFSKAAVWHGRHGSDPLGLFSFSLIRSNGLMVILSKRGVFPSSDPASAWRSSATSLLVEETGLSWAPLQVGM